MTEEELIRLYPRLYHMAHQGSWEAIRARGLMSTKALLDAYEVTGLHRFRLESCRRPESVTLKNVGLPNAVLRDQKPMLDQKLASCLDDGLTTQRWYELLNAKVFFWLSKRRVWNLLGALAYRDVGQTVLTIETATMLAEYRDLVRLSPINSGSTLFNPQRRGLQTFKRIADFPFEERAKTRTVVNNVVELTVEHSVPDIHDHVLAVHSVRNDKILDEIWRRDTVDANEHP